jgi:hypothetical protein
MAEEPITNQPVSPAADESAQPQAVGSGTPSTVPPEPTATAGEAPAEDQPPTVLELLEMVPPQIKDYLLSSDTTKKRRAIYDNFELGEEDRDTALQAELEVFFGALRVGDFPDALFTYLAWEDSEEERVRLMAADIMGLMMLPTDAYLGDVSNTLRDLGVDPTSYPQERIKLNRKGYATAAKEIVAKADLQNLDQEAVHRLEKIVTTYLRDIRDQAETREALTKSPKIGGVGLAVEDAAVITTLADEMREDTVLVDEEAASAAPAAGEEGEPLSAEEIRQRYAGSEAEQEVLSDRFKMLLGNQAALEPEAALDKFHRAIEPPAGSERELWTIVASLMLLAQSGGLISALKTDGKIKTMLIEYMKLRGLQKDLASYEENEADPRYLNMLLQISLRQLAGLDLNDSARFGLRILSILKRQGNDQYAQLAAFDMRDGMFRWIKPMLISE